jgi:predicted branched-subunit amino acid permease
MNCNTKIQIAVDVNKYRKPVEIDLYNCSNDWFLRVEVTSQVIWHNKTKLGALNGIIVLCNPSAKISR